MSGRRPLTQPGDTALRYDGSLKGFYCCVYESVYSRQMPLDIWPAGQEQASLLPSRSVITDAGRAARVRDALAQKVCPRAQTLVETVFLSCLAQKEMPMLRFVVMAFEQGRQVVSMLHHPDVATLLGAERHLEGEAHLLKGFARFSDYEGRLIATIRPKNFILPFLAEHFVERFSQEDFLIYDRTHQAALAYVQQRARILPMEAPPVFDVSQEEAQYRALWRQFYRTISIEARENPVCRRSHMPMRYWSEMTEMQEYLPEKQG